MAGDWTRCGRQSEGEFTELSFRAADDDFALMEIDDGADDVQTQAHAALILASAAVGFVEALKDFGNLLFGDTVAGVFDGDVGHLAF